MGGGGKKAKTPPPSAAETQSAAISKAMWEQTDPLRQGFLQEYGKLFGYVPDVSAASVLPTGSSRRLVQDASGKPRWIDQADPGAGAGGVPSYVRTGELYDPSTSPLYKPMYDVARAGAGTAYRGAKEAILAGTPRGGGQTAALSNLEYQNAKDIGLIPAEISQSIISDMLNKAYGIATGSPQTALSGLSIASNAAAMRQQAAAQSQASSNALKGSLGMGVGMLAAPAFGQCGAMSSKALGKG